MQSKKLFERALVRYHDNSPRAVSTVERFFRLLKKWPDCLNRYCLPGHLTSSAWVSDPGGTEVLLTHHRKLGIWVQLGGHADGNGDLLMVARREAFEESGVTDLIMEPTIERLRRRRQDSNDVDSFWTIFDLGIHPIPARGSVPAHLHFDVRFAFTAPVRIVPYVSRESYDVRWIRLTELGLYTNEASVTRMAGKWTKLRHGMASGPQGESLS